MPSRKGVTFAIVILFLINILNFYDRNVAGALVEPMRREFHLDDTQVGLLGTAFTVLYAIIGVPLGRVADLWSRKKLLGGGMAIWGTLTALAAVVTTFGGLMVSRLGVGVGEAACAPSATSWIGDLVAPAKRARALALFMLGVPVGGALSYFFSGPIAQAYGWRMAMVIAAVPAFVLLPALLFLDEPARGASETHSYKEAPASMFSVLRIPTLWWIIASGALLNFNMYAIGTFMPAALLGRIHGLKVGPAGIATGILYLTGGIAGGALAGWIGDRIVHRRKNGRLVAAALISLCGAPFAYFGAMQPKGALVAAVALWTVAYGALNSYYGLVYSSIQDIVAPAQRGATMALYFMAMYLCGASFGPLLTGRLSDHFARQAAGAGAITDAARAIGLQQAILIVPVLSILLAIVLYMASRTIGNDISRREAAAALARIA